MKVNKDNINKKRKWKVCIDLYIQKLELELKLEEEIKKILDKEKKNK